jgi:hypothetical protein
MAYRQPTGHKRRLVVALPAPNNVVVTMEKFIRDGLTAAKATLFNNDDTQLNEFLSALQGWRVREGFIEHATAGSPNPIYIMTNFLGTDDVTQNPFPYTAANMAAFGQGITASSSRTYLADVHLKDILIYCAANTVKIELDLLF